MVNVAAADADVAERAQPSRIAQVVIRTAEKLPRKPVSRLKRISSRFGVAEYP